MKNRKNRTPLTPLEACTLMAREAVSLLEGDPEALTSATEFREALALLCSTQELGDGGALLAWVDTELERARRFNETGEDIPPLVDLDTPLPLPDPAMQLDAVWLLLQAAAQKNRSQKQWKTTLNAARTLTEMDGLEDLLLTTFTPAGGFLTAENLRSELERVQTTLHTIPEPAGEKAEREMPAMTKEEFERQISALVPQPDPETTAVLFAFGQELGEESEYDGIQDLLNSLDFIARHFDRDVTQGVYEIIRYGSAALPEEMTAAAVFLQDGDTPAYASNLALRGYLMDFYAPKAVGEISPLAVCFINEGEKTSITHTEHFGSFVPKNVLSEAAAYARQHGLSVTKAIQYAAADGTISPMAHSARKLLFRCRPELTEALCDIFACCPAVAARITFDADQDRANVEYNPLWLKLRQRMEPAQGGMELKM